MSPCSSFDQQQIVPFPENLKYSEDHEWVKLEGDVVTVGITDFAQNELGDIVFVELPEPGTAVSAGGDMATVESFKAASSVYAPVSGEVVEINENDQEVPFKLARFIKPPNPSI